MTSRAVALHQPYLFPYIGYFQLINSCDVFGFRDDCQWIKNGWINRNKIFSNGREEWLTLPVEKIHSNDRIFEVKIANPDFKKELLSKVGNAYAKAPNKDLVMDLVNGLKDTTYVYELVEHSLNSLLFLLGINTSIISCLNVKTLNASAEARVIDICKELRAGTYINMVGGQHLYSKENFYNHEITLKFLHPNTPSYRYATLPPTRSEIPVPGHLSILDMLAYLDLEEVKNKLQDYHLE